MKRLRIAMAAALVFTLCATLAFAGGKRGGSRGPGTGSSSSSSHVRSYTRSGGTKVQAHRRSSADSTFNNNFTTKGNTNPFTGQSGTRVTPPKRK